MDRLGTERSGHSRFSKSSKYDRLTEDIYEEFTRKRHSPHSKDRKDSKGKRKRPSRSPKVVVKKESYDDFLFSDDDDVADVPKTSKKNGSAAGPSSRTVHVKPESRYILHVSISKSGCFATKIADKLAEYFDVDIHFQNMKKDSWIYCLNNKTQFEKMVTSLYSYRIIDKEIILEYDHQLENQESHVVHENLSSLFRSLMPSSEEVKSLIPKVVRDKVHSGDRLVRGLEHSLVWYIKSIHAAAFRRRSDTGVQTLLITLSPVNFVFFKLLDMIAKFFKLHLYSPSPSEPFDYERAGNAHVILTPISSAVSVLRTCNLSNLSTLMIDDISSIINRSKSESALSFFIEKLSNTSSYGSISKIVTIRQNCPNSAMDQINKIMDTDLKNISVHLETPNLDSSGSIPMEIDPTNIKKEHTEEPTNEKNPSPHAKSKKNLLTNAGQSSVDTVSASSKFNNKLLIALSRNSMSRLTTSYNAKIVDAEFLLSITEENLLEHNVPKSILMKLYELLLLIKENKNLLPPNTLD